jgi:hypothetical protein
MVSLTVPQHPFNITINFQIIILSLVIAFLIILPVMGLSSLQSWIIYLLLTVLIYVVISTLSPLSPLNGPFAVRPLPPHLGLDGVSLNSLNAGSTL